MRVTHDAALLDITVLAEQAANLILGQARVNASDEEVGSRVDGIFLVIVVAWSWGRTTVGTGLSTGNGDEGCRKGKAYRSSLAAGEALRILLSPSRSGRGERERSRGYWGSSDGP